MAGSHQDRDTNLSPVPATNMVLKRKPKEEKGKEELNSACFCGKRLFLMFLDNLLPVDPQVKLHYPLLKK